MLFDYELLKTILRELSQSEPFPRMPEPDLVMDDENSVDAFTRGGREDGVMGGAYLYHLAQLSAIVRPGETVLDLGCGSGMLLCAVARLHPRSEFVGVDLSLEMLERAKKTLEERRLSNVSFVHSDMTDLNAFGTGTIDVVMSSMALHHLPDAAALDRTFSEISRVLRTDGALYINDFGRLRSLNSVDYFVRRAVGESEPILAEDYRNSLLAAFTKDDFIRSAERWLSDRVRVHSTIISPLMVVVTSGARTAIDVQRPELKRLRAALPSPRRADFRQMRTFLRLGGLACPL